MLELLRITNLALIEDISMEFSSGINALTGETGAGKSFILKAISFLTGDKLGSDLVRPGKEKAIVEGLFYIDDTQYIIRRELLAESGRSRLYINDQLSSQEAIKSLQPSLILHTSQHGQQKLLQPVYQAKILDDFMNRPDLIERKDELIDKLTDCSKRKKELEKNFTELENKREMLEFQLAEIDKVKPLKNEEEQLEIKRNQLRSNAELTENTTQALEIIYGSSEHSGIFNGINKLNRNISVLAKINESFKESPSLLIEIKELVEVLASSLQKASVVQDDDEEIERIEERLYQLSQLERKLKRPLSSILLLQDEITNNLNFLDSCAINRKELLNEENELCTELATVLNELYACRQEAAAKLCSLLEKELTGLGFSEHVKISFSFSPSQIYPDRDDCVEMRARLLWKPNPGMAEQPLDKIASGGELSRFLLALVTLLSQKNLDKPTLIFDEVDAGVGGNTLTKVGDHLESLSRHQQMLLITHWPQLAKRANRHFIIKKQVVGSETYTTCSQLVGNAIEAELARMLGQDASNLS